ncbi:MAG: hypothetical protein ACOYB4_07275, partial [Methyloceanibacter sp.]
GVELNRLEFLGGFLERIACLLGGSLGGKCFTHDGPRVALLITFQDRFGSFRRGDSPIFLLQCNINAALQKSKGFEGFISIFLAMIHDVSALICAQTGESA